MTPRNLTFDPWLDEQGRAQPQGGVLQREADEVGGEGSTQTDVIILTHDCLESKMNAAMVQMQALSSVLAPITRIRKEELA